MLLLPKPDCDYKDRTAKRGCRERAVFRLFLKSADGGYVKHAFYACRSHAPQVAKFLRLMVKLEQENGNKSVRVAVQDLDMLFQKARRLGPVALKVIVDQVNGDMAAGDRVIPDVFAGVVKGNTGLPN